jgi:serine/threonine-protein kinase
MEMEDMVGKTLGNWRIMRVLGTGAFGVVFEVEHIAIAGRRGAAKILKPEMSMQASIKQRFLNEASAASRAEHENIVQIFDGGIAPDGTCYQVMELLTGKPLSKLLKQDGRLDAARSINITVQIASALQAAHNLQIVHRDLKPDNVFIVERTTNPEFVKVLDFGVAKLRGDPATPTSDKLTSLGMLIGTAPYMAPEQWQARPDIDGRADIFALGVIVFEMLCGKRPYTANSDYEWIVLHMEATPPDLTQYGVSAPLNRAVRRMLGRTPELRQQSMREVIQDLRTASRGIRNIAAFASDGVHSSAPTALRPMPGEPEEPPTQALVQPHSQPPVEPQPLAQSQPQFLPPPPPQPLYQSPPPTPQPPPVDPNLGLVVPPAQVQDIQPVSPFRRFMLRIGEIGLVLILFVAYLLWNWHDTVNWFHSFLDSLKPSF